MTDPIQDYLDNSCDKNAGDVTVSPELAPPPRIRQPSLWRQEPCHSFSDWKIILVTDEDDAATSSIQDTSIDCKELGEPIISNNDEIIKCDSSTMDASITTFHVHRCILAHVSSYFHSQFSQHLDTMEKTTSTSTIRLQRNAVQAFPVFLDYLYSTQIGRASFSRENAVALRHLAMYFGVDVLLKDITSVILADLNRPESRVIFQEEAHVFNDEKLLEALKTFKVHQNILLPLAETTYDSLAEDVDRYLTEDYDAVIKSWLYISRYMDSDHDAFFAARNAENFPDIFVGGAGVEKVNGHYKLVGTRNDVGYYSNGVCMIFREAPHENQPLHTWSFDFNYGKSGTTIYFCRSDSDQPPTTGWEEEDEDLYAPPPTCIIPLKPKTSYAHLEIAV